MEPCEHNDYMTENCQNFTNAVQTAAARELADLNLRDLISQVLASLPHWLPVKSR